MTYEKGLELAEMLKDIQDPTLSMAQWALRWILDHEEISTVIPGASTPSQIEDNTEASYLDPIPPEIHQQLASFYEEKVKDHIRGAY